MSIRIMVGDALTRLRELPAESVHCVVCSPPYWSMRDYGVSDPALVGSEPTLAEHLANLVAIFAEVRRVLRPDGLVWLKLRIKLCGGRAGRGRGLQAAHEQGFAHRPTA